MSSASVCAACLAVAAEITGWRQIMTRRLRRPTSRWNYQVLDGLPTNKPKPFTSVSQYLRASEKVCASFETKVSVSLDIAGISQALKRKRMQDSATQ